MLAIAAQVKVTAQPIIDNGTPLVITMRLNDLTIVMLPADAFQICEMIVEQLKVIHEAREASCRNMKN